MNGVIFQCAACRSLCAIVDVQVHEDRAGLACNVCGCVTWLPAQRGAEAGSSSSSSSSSSSTVVVDAPRGLPPVTALTRPVTNLVWSQEQTEKVKEKLRSLAAANETQDQLAGGFEALLGNWDDANAHKELCKRASSQGELAFIGQRYRAVLDAVPGDAQAKRSQSEILTLATAALAATKDLGAVPSEDAIKKRRTAAMLVGAAIVILIYLILQVTGLLRPAEQEGMIDSAPPVQE